MGAHSIMVSWLLQPMKMYTYACVHVVVPCHPLGWELVTVRELGLGIPQRSSIRGGMLHIRALVFMLHTHACVHAAVRVRTRHRS